MFYYYGAKHRLAPLYPPPEHVLIVEPFAGAAGYSCFWAAKRPGHHRFLLIEKDPRVTESWRRILGGEPMPPCPPVGSYTDDFLVMTAATSNAVARLKALKVTPRVVKVYEGMVRRVERLRPLMAEQTAVWTGDYTLAPKVEATFFVDPPYQPPGKQSNLTAFPRGMGYAPACSADSIDYTALGGWVGSLAGQVIVCEQEGADWLPFVSLSRQGNSQGRHGLEMVWVCGGRG